MNRSLIFLSLSVFFSIAGYCQEDTVLSKNDDTLTMFDYRTFKADRPLGFVLDINEGNGTTLFIGKIRMWKLLFWKKGIRFYGKRSGMEPVRIMHMKSMEKYKGKRPRLKNFQQIGSKVYAVAELKKKGTKYILLQEMDIDLGGLRGKPKAIIRQKTRGLKNKNKFEYSFRPTPDGQYTGVIYDQTRKKYYKIGDKKYILLDQDLNKVGKRRLKTVTKSSYGKQKVTNKNAHNFHILNDGSLYSDVSENFRKKKELELDGLSLLVYPIDTSYVHEVLLRDKKDMKKESTIGGLSWWHSNSTYSAIGLLYKKQSIFKYSQEVVITNTLHLDNGDSTQWTKLDYPIADNADFMHINAYTIDGQRVAMINHYERKVEQTRDQNGSTSVVYYYVLRKLDVIAFDDSGNIERINPIKFDYYLRTYNYTTNPYTLFKKNKNIYFVNHEREHFFFIPTRSYYEITRLTPSTGEVRYEQKTVKNRVPGMYNSGNELYEHTVSSHRTRISQLFHGRRVYEFEVR